MSAQEAVHWVVGTLIVGVLIYGAWKIATADRKKPPVAHDRRDTDRPTGGPRP